MRIKQAIHPAPGPKSAQNKMPPMMHPAVIPNIVQHAPALPQDLW